MLIIKETVHILMSKTQPIFVGSIWLSGRSGGLIPTAGHVQRCQANIAFHATSVHPAKRASGRMTKQNAEL